MVNVLSKSKPGHGRETTARQQHCHRKSSIKTGLASNWDSDRSRRAWTSVALPGRTPSPWSPQPSPCFAAAFVQPRSAPQHRSFPLGGGTALPRDFSLEPEAHRRGTSRSPSKKHIDTTRSVANAWASSAAPLWSSCIIQPKLANYDERGQEEVISGLTAHCEQLDLVAVGLTGQQLVIKTCATTGTSTL